MLYQAVPARSCRTTTSPVSANRALAVRISVPGTCPGASRRSTGGTTVTRTAALAAPPGPARRNKALAARWCTARVTSPRRSVIALPASRQPGHPSTCSNSCARTPGSGRPLRASRPEKVSSPYTGILACATARTTFWPAALPVGLPAWHGHALTVDLPAGHGHALAVDPPAGHGHALTVDLPAWHGHAAAVELPAGHGHAAAVESGRADGTAAAARPVLDAGEWRCVSGTPIRPSMR
jgi:hypothetical protein